MSSALRIERYPDNELSDCAISPAPSLPEFGTESVSNEAALTEAVSGRNCRAGILPEALLTRLATS